MATVTLTTGAHSLVIYGKLGKPNGVGEHVCGVSFLGEFLSSAGIYRRTMTRNGRRSVRMAHYVPANPQTTAQQSRRLFFANGVLSWHALSENERHYWRKLKSPPNRNGFQRYMSAYMKGNI